MNEAASGVKPGAAIFLSILLIKFRHISIGPELDAGKPIRHPCHPFTEHFQRYILGAFDDELIVDMSADKTVRECLHSIHQEVSGNSLNHILDELRPVAFKPLPFFIGPDPFVGD